MSRIRVTTLCPMFNRLRPFEIQGQYCLAMYKHDRTYYRGFVKAVTDDIAKVCDSIPIRDGVFYKFIFSGVFRGLW